MTRGHWAIIAMSLLLCASGTAQAQRAGDNAVTSAQDAFGTTVGNDTIGLYSIRDARGFSPTLAGNIRMEGLYFDRQGNQGNYDRLFSGSAVHVGLSAQSYPFPAPTGIADFKLRIPGDKQVTSAVATIGPYDQTYLEIDTQIPIMPGKLSLGLGGGHLRTAYEWGSHSFTWTGGAIAHWTPTEDIEITPFWTKSSINDWEVRPFTFSSGAFLPPKFNRTTYFGQPYSDWEENDANFGVITRARLWSNWTLRVGLFRSLSVKPEDALIFYFNGDRNGLSDVNLLSNPRQRSGSYSGEIRATGVYAEGPRRHTVHLNARGRDNRRLFGGGDLRNVGKYPTGVYIPIPRPNFVYGPSTREHVSQGTGGVAYEGLWNDVGELSLGLQKTRYRQTSAKPTAAVAQTTSTPWLYNGTLAIHATDRLAIYGSYTRGLEESGTAPNNATNRDTILPASLTDQIDAGIRYTVSPNLKVVAGVFEVKKPFYDRDPSNFFTRVGDLRHRGIELSLAGTAVEDLTVVAGAVILQARASGILVDQGLIGRVPGGRPPLVARINAQYHPADWHGLSVDGQYEYTIQGYSNSFDILKLPPYSQINLGARYRSQIFGAPATLRVQVLNVTNTWGWSSGGGPLAFFQHSAPRRVIASLTADF